MNRQQVLGFSILHALGVLLLPLLIGLLGGCLEIEQLQTPPPASCEDVEFAMNDASTFQLNSLHLNDFVHTEESMAPLANNPQVTSDTIEKLIVINPLPGHRFEVHRFKTVISYRDGQSKEETKEAIGFVPNTYSLCPSPENISYHGLQVFHRKMRVTEFKTDCGDFADCQIDITEVKFDQLYRMDNGKQEVRKYSFMMSKDVPYLAMNLKTCVSGTVDVNGQPVPLTQCSRVKNFGNKP